MLQRIALALFLVLLSTRLASAQTITIDGVADRVTRTNSATFRVQTNAGFSYAVTLNGVSVPAGISNTVTKMDFYELAVARTNTSTLAVANVLVRFIIESSNRLLPSATTSPELGLLEWVPLPPISSTAAEMAGARLGLITPQTYPAGLDIPVIARVEDGAGNERRVNGWVSAPGFEASPFRILRGVGFGLLPPATAGSTLSFNGSLQNLQTNKQIVIESNTVWTPVSGVLGNTTWPDNSRIHVTTNLTIPATATLTIGAGTIVRLNAGVNITNSGRTVINGTTDQPVVFTPTNRVVPEVRAGAWGGWIMRGTSSVLIANAAIMTGSGAQQANFSFSPGTSHKTNQALILAHSGATVWMTNCALINQAGQVGNGYNSFIIWDHCLIQRANTCGEYDGCTNIINHSALIEFPSIDGIYDATIADADYDDYYCVAGSNYIANSLFGFCKDDAIDSGSGNFKTGQVVVVNCWIESALHEALAWSGYGRQTWTYDTVLMNSGQGFECGWSGAINSSPLCYGGRILSTANCVGARYGDNYTGTSGLGAKDGFLTLTNSYVIHNYRDVFGHVWDNTWDYRTNKMDVHSNWLTAPNLIHPSNFVWNPSVDAARLVPFMSTPVNAPVGIGLALWNLNITSADLTNGIPVRLSSFTTHPVTVDYAIEKPDSSVTSGTLTFTAGETVKKIFANPASLGGASIWRVALSNPTGGELTGTRAAYALAGGATNTFIITNGSAWKYIDDGVDQGTAWRALDFNDSGWSNGVAQLGFGESDETTKIRRTNSLGTNYTAYFRKVINVPNAAQFASLGLQVLRDDAVVVHINGSEVFRSANLPSGGIVYTNLATSTGENTVDSATLAQVLTNGLNILAVEIHQESLGSSDLSFDLQLTGNPSTTPRIFTTQFGNQWALDWAASGFLLEQADDVTGPWTPLVDQAHPSTVEFSTARKFYRLRK